jgi:eukaryotic-like serine/threonine-protein kinase
VFCPECGTWNRAAAAHCARCSAELPELPNPRAEPPDAELGALRRLTGSRYRILARLGGGGMAHVYYAQHLTLGRPLVLKVLHPHLARELEMRERFRREAEAAAQLVHPHVCAILDYGESNDAAYIVMPYCAGGSLANTLTRDRTVQPGPAAAIGVQVACALDYAHRRGIVHRDVKPDNVLFDEDGYALLTDFGIATARFHGRLTGAGRAMGTPHYMSPEQAMGRMVDGRSDLYAVGVMLYEMLVGIPPFDGADSYSVGYKQVHEEPVPPEVVDSRVPSALNAVVMRCLAKAPAERYQRGFDLADALLEYLGEGSASTPEARAAWRARRGGQSSLPSP